MIIEALINPIFLALRGLINLLPVVDYVIPTAWIGTFANFVYMSSYLIPFTSLSVIFVAGFAIDLFLVAKRAIIDIKNLIPFI